MFGRGGFDWMRFDVVLGDGDEVRFGGEFGAAFRQMAGPGENVHEMLFAHEGIEGRLAGAAAAYEGQALGVWMGQGAQAQASLLARMDAAAEMGARAVCSPRLWLQGLWQAEVGAAAYFGRELCVAGALEALLHADVFAACDCALPQVLADAFVNAQVTTREIAVDEAFLNITLRPGDVLEMNSDTYTITLNGQNVLDKHTGAWLRLSPDILDLILAPSQGIGTDLSATATYRVLWL